ncbi:MAG: restriction endonuclease [Planctomycetes bacterium]|nr:restriction endonuclease [Planctomycetota bacterium]
MKSPRPPSIARHHAEWLSLVEVSGPFLSMPVLLRVFPQGLDKDDSETRRALKDAWEEWTASLSARRPDPAAHRAWLHFVLRVALGFPPDALLEGQAVPPNLAALMPEQGETLRPDLVVAAPPGTRGEGAPRVLVVFLPATQDADKPQEGRAWKASPATRMMELLHATSVRLGLVTNGEQWTLVYAPRGETTGFASWYAEHWFDDPITLQAFRSLLGVARLVGVAEGDTLEALLAESSKDQQEVTDQLGRQVRNAVELLVQAIDRINGDRGGALLKDVSEPHLYEAAVTVMMRLVFLFSAEERGLLLLGQDPVYTEHYAVSTLGAQLRESADRHGEEVLERRFDAWGRLLATFRAVHGGVQHDRLRLRGYGGTLFDPDRFPFLEGRPLNTRWRETPAAPLPIDNRTALHLLEALQFLQVKVPGGGPAEARRLSFTALDIEQIGHVYESLLDHEARRAAEPVLGLLGTKDLEPEIPLARLEAFRAKGIDPLVDYLREQTGRSAAALRKALQTDVELDEGHLLAACDNDPALCARVQPFAAVLRTNSRGYPVVIGAGGVFVTEGIERRSTGTHYTPRSLTEPIVRHALEPLVFDGPAEGRPRDAWRLRTAREILALKVCDFAMGSGAFLVQTCRYLSELLVEAWELAEKASPGRIVVTPEGELSVGQPSERPLPTDVAERLALARQVVADRCLYGVDVNPMAVEMAKLSLWLVTLQKDRPFTFLDHALRCGDSLLGLTDPEQIHCFHLEPERGREIHEGLFNFPAAFRPAFEAALEKRAQLARLPVNDVRDLEAKARLQREAEDALERVKLMADGIVLTALAQGEAGSAVLDGELKELATGLGEALSPRRSAAEQERLLVEVRKRVKDTLTATRDPRGRLRRPFHWILEFPELFADAGNGGGGGAAAGGKALRGTRGFDAIAGNPPFRGGQLLRQTLGGDYREYMVSHLAGGQRGSADLCAYFFLRARGLLKDGGSFGLLATNTIAQGDTSEVGLEQVTGNGCTIYRAVPSRQWPGEATLEVAHVWVRRGAWAGEHVLEERGERTVLVDGISPQLAAKGAVAGKPFRLAANAGRSFQGSIVLGMGFVLEPEEAQALIRKDPRNREVLYPYLNGEDLNSRPDQSASRWVINFHDWPLERAEEHPDCMRIVREKVKPERDKNPRKPRRERWWQFAERQPALYAAIAGLERVLAMSQVSAHLSLATVPRSQVFSHTLYVLPQGVDPEFACLQCSIHEVWARTYASTLETRLRYTPTDCLETFPFPPLSPILTDLARRYHDHRASIMRTRDEGLTTTYNRFHDPAETAASAPDIAALRDLHVTLDRAVAAAYGWSDLDLGHGFHETKLGLRFTLSEAARAEVLDRLLRLNHERHAEEVELGFHTDGRKSKKGSRRPPPSSNSGPDLFP